MKEISVIGLGGIGSILVNILSQFEDSLHDDVIINLVDGDEYELKNKDRQSFIGIGKNKAEAKKHELSRKWERVDFKEFPVFVTEDNVNQFVKENSIVFVCVDNHKSRKIINDAAENLNDVMIISGGNEMVDGNSQSYVRKGGKKLTPSLTDYHNEIKNPTDKHPNEMSCEELMKSEPQLLFTNFSVVDCMFKLYFNNLNGNYVSEVYFDNNLLTALPKERKPKYSKNLEE